VWNKATIAKLVWAVIRKKDILWVKWVHGRYSKHRPWWDNTPAQDSSGHWRRICQVKEDFKIACTNPLTWNGKEKSNT